MVMLMVTVLVFVSGADGAVGRVVVVAAPVGAAGGVAGGEGFLADVDCSVFCFCFWLVFGFWVWG